jgi:lysophospholipase L1-like esterase
MKNKLLVCCAIIILFQSVKTNAQSFPAFAKEIGTFKKEDSVNNPPKNAILFVGSSSFARWNDIADYFPGYAIINRGFGGSGLIDVIRYAYDIIIPYQPKQVIIYVGDNDLAGGVTIQDVVTRFKTLFQIIRTNLPNTTIDYVSIKPSPLREQLMPKMKQANMEIQEFLKTQKNTGFIDIFSLMLNENGKPKVEIFVEDRLHMNAQGYAIWKQVILPYLKK